MAAPWPHCDREEARAENTHNGDGDEVVLVQAFHPSATTAAGSTLPDVSPAPVVLSDGEDAPPPTAPTDGAHAAPTCCTCLEPLLPSGVGRRAVVYWPGCRHAYHFACLARSRAQVHPPRCPLCRHAWDPALDASLSSTCHGLHFNPFQESEPERATPPPSPRPRGAAAWRQRGPPSGIVRTDANSWLYVPLLLAATGELHEDAALAWQQATATTRWWERARQALTAAPPVPLTTLLEALHACPAAGALSSHQRLSRQAAALPPGAQAHLGWAVRHLCDPDAYVPAAGQEVLLQLYGGLHLAADLDRHSDTFRARPDPPAPIQLPADPGPVHPAVETSAPRELATIRALAQQVARAHRPPPRRGGRGRGCGRHAAAADPAPAEPAEVPDPPPPPPSPSPNPAARLQQALRSLDDLDLAHTLRVRVSTFQGAPRRLQGVLAFALRLGLTEICDHPANTDPAQARGWKLFLLAPRMLCYRSRPGERAEPSDLDRRATMFRNGQWHQLLGEAASSFHPTAPSSSVPSADARASRAASLAHQGELSAAARSLVAEPLAPLSSATLAELRNPSRRPQVRHRPLSDDVASFQPDELLHVDATRFLQNLRRARRGAAAGPSGCTNEHLRVLLESESDSRLLCDAASLLASARVPPLIMDGLRVGRLVALQKGNGRVRGLVMSDVFRRLVGRTLAQQFSAQFQEACHPFQYALSTKAGAEGLARAVRVATELDPRATVLSVDGVGAFDHVGRQSMLGSLLRSPALRPLLPYARLFYGQDSTYLWWDSSGACHSVQQAEGGEQGDPLMPALFALAQHPALQETAATMRSGEALFAFLDDIYVISSPDRTHALYSTLRVSLRGHACIELNQGKTRIWNAAGEEPCHLPELQPADSNDRVWVGDWTLPPSAQGLQVLGTPIGSAQYVQHALTEVRTKQDLLLHRIPWVENLQAAWLLLLFCAAPRSNYLLRVLPPADTSDFAAAHDAAVAHCVSTLVAAGAALTDLQLRRAQLPLRLGGCGLRSAHRSRLAAYWASWADTLPILHSRLPLVADRLLQLLNGEARPQPPSILAASQAAQLLRNSGATVPPWESIIGGRHFSHEDRTPGDFLRGWQRDISAAQDLDELAALLSDLSPPERALLLSQAGPHSGRAVTTLPTSPEFQLGNPHFRTLLQRRLRAPLSCGPSRCRCGLTLDPHGDHRAACATTGVLRARAAPIERAVARICREAGARVAVNVPLSRMNLAVPVTDARQIEVLANDLPLWHGAQLAVDVTLVSPLGRTGQVRHASDANPGAAILAASQRKREHTYPEFSGSRRCHLIILGLEVGGRWGEEAADFLRALAHARARTAPALLRSAAVQAYVHRWAGLLSVAAQRALAETLLELPAAAAPGVDGEPPPFAATLADVRWHERPPDSRLPR